MAYGDKRDYKKIDIYLNGVYKCSTTWAKSLTVAKVKFMEGYCRKNNLLTNCRVSGEPLKPNFYKITAEYA